jgi:hypothetical protein
LFIKKFGLSKKKIHSFKFALDIIDDVDKSLWIIKNGSTRQRRKQNWLQDTGSTDEFA